MAQAYWKILDEVRLPNADLYLQKGEYHFFDGRPFESGVRFIWRVNGKQQARPARMDNLSVVQTLIDLARDKGWET